MLRRCLSALSLALLLAIPVAAQEDQAREPEARPLAHMVYFTLAEDTPENREALVAACRKYLTEHEGTVHFSVGIIGEEFDRDVNDTEFDIALNLIFRNKEAHDVYQTHPRHLEFIETSSHLWSKVRVFDSYVVTPVRARREGERRRDTDAPREGDRPRESDAPRDRERSEEGNFISAVSGFAGEVTAEVTAIRDAGVVVQVADVSNIWRGNRAENPQALVGRGILVVAGDNANVRKFLGLLEQGAEVRLDLAHVEGERFRLVELNADQRERIER